MLLSPVMLCIKRNWMTYPMGQLVYAHSFTQQPTTEVATEWFVGNDWLYRWNRRNWNIRGMRWATMMRYYFFLTRKWWLRMRWFLFLLKGLWGILLHRLYESLPTSESSLTLICFGFTVLGLPIAFPWFFLRLMTGNLWTIAKAVSITSITTSTDKNRCHAARAQVTSTRIKIVFIHQLWISRWGYTQTGGCEILRTCPPVGAGASTVLDWSS